MSLATGDRRPYLPAMGQGRLLPLYDTFSLLAGARRPQWRLVAQAGIGPGDTVLEIGAGTGTVLLMAARAVPTATVIGLDPDPAALEVAHRRAAAAGVALELVEGYADRIPQADGSVDRLLSAFMFHHLPGREKAAALAEARRVLAPGGSLHLVDLGGEEPGALARRLHRHHDHHDHDDRDDHAGRPETARAPAMVAMLRGAGFASAEIVGRAPMLVGPTTFYRAAV